MKILITGAGLTDMQTGDVTVTYADVSELVRDFDYKPSTPISEGIREFITWFKSYYNAVPDTNSTSSNS